MNATGLITEYNPFHNGHLYHLNQAKSIDSDAVIIVLMSGNWVQRGTPAIVDKWQRADIALRSGADLVFELPFYFAVQPGDIFAQGAIRLLNDLSINRLVFGSEHPNTDFIELAEQSVLLDGDESFTNKNATYASNFANALQKETGFKLDQANDILAFSYAKAIYQQKLMDKIEIKPIKRISSDYHQSYIDTDSKISSATAIRRALSEGKDVSNLTPMHDLEYTDYEKKYFDLLKYRLVTDNIGQIRSVYQVNEGIEFLLKNAISNDPQNFGDFIAEIKSKRYTFARLRRVLSYVLLNIKVDQMRDAMAHPYHRLLAFNAKGRQYLHDNKKNFAFPVISHLDYKKATKDLLIDYKAGLVYSEIMGLDKAQDLQHKPIQL